MTTYARSVYRAHIGKALSRNYWTSSTTTALGTTSSLVDAARTEHDQFWAGATCRLNPGASPTDVPVRGGAGANTGRSPTIYFDQAVSPAVPNSTPYELLKIWTFVDVDEAIDDAFSSMWPYFCDWVTDISNVLVQNQVEYPLTQAWKDIYEVRLQVLNQTNPVLYRLLQPTIDYSIRQDAAGPTLVLKAIPDSASAGLQLRILSREVPSIAAGDTSTSSQPWQVVVPGALAYLYEKGANADMGALSERFEKKAATALAMFEKRRQEYAEPAPARDLILPTVRIGYVGATEYGATSG